ncbi:hypothetical protein SERLA73DRAFT_177851 [Serpula lacrymans var. lacrymans S7.3]|uniref:Eukaryotic translation initiation factor 3 subunit M n=2 Tax=Serpula lacrymans var. lacrymans TaxID=341189 RepID=F8PPP9_SERL3|nr:uncharacterized protein SERLADRAFT_461665 [Serpula lacrymans var. lacrymans S7.9]EGO02107.1 hypothetical protein SERLA73DRAFT_177851 [Serpula lacrymans var. lacrymans S7.3]EGO27730.1 hypothetical protein SERLADRAFT_461665 [Serpula lacrymans var. lacrymans S7.9]
MFISDSVSVFAEGTYEEQIHELVDYIARNRSEEDRTALTQSFQQLLKTDEGAKSLDEDDDRKRTIFSAVLNEVKGLGDGNEKEIEGFFNLLYSHLFSLWDSELDGARKHVTTLLRIISSSTSENPAPKYRILSNLFNATPRSSALRLPIYTTLLQIATSNGNLDILCLSKKDVEQWLQQWNISAEEKSEFLKSIIDALTKSGQQEAAYEYTLPYLVSLPPSSPSSQQAAVDAIATALRLPSIFDFDSLFKLDAVVAAKDHELFGLLHIFLSEGLTEFNTWVESHAEGITKYNLEKSQLERKIRLLTFASLGFDNIGRDLSYAQIASTLQIDPTEVEKWSIDVIRTGLLSGKLSQTAKTLYVTRSTARTFQREQWEVLEKRLASYKADLAGVLDVVIAARRRHNGNVVSALQQVSEGGNLDIAAVHGVVAATAAAA